tara:strand:+ start:223 stop:450 length:228 start_codon:yes stop_codon:yes gene_type:complete
LWQKGEEKEKGEGGARRRYWWRISVHQQQFLEGGRVFFRLRRQFDLPLSRDEDYKRDEDYTGHEDYTWDEALVVE